MIILSYHITYHGKKGEILNTSNYKDYNPHYHVLKLPQRRGDAILHLKCFGIEIVALRYIT